MSRKRDHKAEYRRRIERAAAKGLSRSQARGHPRPGESALKGKARPASPDARLEAALLTMRRGKSLGSAASEGRVSRERLSAYIKQRAGAARSGRLWTFNDRRQRQLPIFEGGERPVIRVFGYEYARLAGAHWNDALQTLAEPSARSVAEFQHRWRDTRVRDTAGTWHTLSTDLNEIARAAHAYDEPFDQIYRLIG